MLITIMKQDYIWGSPISMDYMYFTKQWLKFGFTNQKSLKINDQLRNIHSEQTGDMRPTKNKCPQQLELKKFLELKQFQ